MIRIKTDNCIKCGKCVQKCPFGALKIQEGEFPEVLDTCVGCGVCVNECPTSVIVMDEAAAPATDFSEYKGVFVFAELERQSRKVRKVTLELMSEGRRIADLLKEELKVVVLSSELPPELELEAGKVGCDGILFVRNPVLEEYDTDLYADVVQKVCEKYKPSILFVPATEMGRDLAPRVSAKLHTGLTADCTGFDVDKNGNLIQIRPTYGGNIMASIVSPNHRPQMASVRPNVFQIISREKRNAVGIEVADIPVDVSKKRTWVKKIEENLKSYKDVSESDVVIVAGYGVGSEENFKKIERLAVRMGAAFGATRKVVDEGWAPFDIQVGQTGKTIAPELYISFGVSGALQHTIGIRNAKHIIAVNNDPAALIFTMCDEAILGDCMAVAEKMGELLDKEEAGGNQ